VVGVVVGEADVAAECPRLAVVVAHQHAVARVGGRGKEAPLRYLGRRSLDAVIVLKGRQDTAIAGDDLVADIGPIAQPAGRRLERRPGPARVVAEGSETK
jgi:hypothetical protein